MLAKMNRVQIVVILGMLLVSACVAQAQANSLPNNPGSITAVAASNSPSTPATATPEPIPELDPAIQAGMELCGNILPGQACLVEGPVQVEAQPESYLMPFREPGQTLNLADIQRLKLGEAGSTKGVVVMRISTEWPGGSFTALALGDVELVNEVPYGTREFNPMQSLKLATGPNQEGQTPSSGFFVASPDDGDLSTLVVNGVELSIGSGGWLTSQEGGLTIETMWGSVGAWIQDRIVQVKRGFGLRLTHEEIELELAKEPYVDPASRTVIEVLKKYFGNPENGRKWQDDPAYRTVKDALAKYFGCKDWRTNSGCGNKEDSDYDKKYRALEELRRKQKRWKGGWWKMTYGPVTTSGQCKMEAAGDGAGGGDGEPYTVEIPVCRGNNGNTILFYELGVSYDRVGANLYNQSSVSEFDFLGNGNYTTEGNFQTLQIVSPLRMILSNNRTEADGCTSASVVYLDFVRDDPNVRCGQIIYIDPFETPEAPTPTPEPQNVDPPVEGQYNVRIGTLTKACDAQAMNFAPSFTTASLSLSAENNLIVDADSTKYELELSKLTYPYSSRREDIRQNRFGIFNLQQPVDDSFGLMMTLVQMPGQQWSGSWVVMNEDASKLCGGSIDLLLPK